MRTFVSSAGGDAPLSNAVKRWQTLSERREEVHVRGAAGKPASGSPRSLWVDVQIKQRTTRQEGVK